MKSVTGPLGFPRRGNQDGYRQQGEQYGTLHAVYDDAIAVEMQRIFSCRWTRFRSGQQMRTQSSTSSLRIFNDAMDGLQVLSGISSRCPSNRRYEAGRRRIGFSAENPCPQPKSNLYAHRLANRKPRPAIHGLDNGFGGNPWCPAPFNDKQRFPTCALRGLTRAASPASHVAPGAAPRTLRFA